MKLLYTYATVLSAALISFLISSSAQAADPKGDWLRPKSGAIVTVFECKTGLGLKVKKAATGAKKPERIVGKIIACDLKKDGENKWIGLLLNTDDSKFYSGRIVLKNSDTLVLDGCDFQSEFCQGENWKRVK